MTTTSVHLVYYLILLGIVASKDPFDQQPRISVEDGHMILRGAQDKNITLLSSGGGSVFVNSVDFSSLSLMAQSLISGNVGQSSTMSTISQKIQELQSRMESLSDLEAQMNQLQNNLTNLASRVASGTGSRGFGARFRSVQRKVTALENQVKTLNEYLTRDDCSSNPCRNGGSCVDVYNGYICQCPSNWEGPTCESDVNECSLYAGTSFACQNGATCYNSPGSYRCECPPNWYGIHCSQSHDDCSTASHTELCSHGTCVNEKRNTPGQPKYKCICDEGWTTGNGLACDQDIDECAGNKHTCSQNPPVQCINLPGSFHCGHCPYGFTGNGHSCSDINECNANNGGCHPLVTCLNTVGSRQCGPCPAGYIGDGAYCSFVGVCAVNRGGCHPLATCIENSAITGTFRECRCPPGYTGHGEGLTGCIQGEQPLSCVSNPCVHGLCQMTGNSQFCTCYAGFTGPICDQPVSPCYSQPCLNGATCVAQGNQFTCICMSNFEGLTCAIERQACGGYLRNSNGTLSYPATPGQEYGHRENCVWIISVNETKAVNITINSLHLENGPNCPFDFLQINDGHLITSRMLGRFCGINTNVGSVIQSTHSDVYVWFHTDHSVAGYGFTITWNSTDVLCGEDLPVAPYGAINSPGYPGNYPQSRDCYWHVRVPIGNRIQFHFATLKLENHENCSFDFLKLYDGLSETDPILETYCTTVTPQPIVSSGSGALLYFHSDSYVEDTGFHITYAAIPSIHGCGGSLTAPTGSLSSPNFPDSYDRQLSCEWLIRIHPNNKIQLTFTDFHLEHHSSCDFDYVEVYDGPNSDSQLLRRFCGINVPPPIMSNSHQLFIKFKTDSTVQYNGFRATYKTICGGTYTELQGTFSSPYYPDPYPRLSTCYFLITLPPGNLIQLDFQFFHLELTSDCNYDYVKVYDGASEQSTLYGPYCGTIPPETITSSYNEMLVKFITDGSVNNQGFLANYTNIVVGCGGVLTTDHGYVSSPAHPNYYPPSMTCNWLIRAPAGYVVQLTFAAFILEYHAQCNYDYVLIRDTNGAVMGRKYCGNELPPVLTTMDNEMRVTFVADSNVLREGFNASYTFLEASRTCGGSYHLESGVVRSPGFPANYPHSATCKWTLNAQAGHQIQLTVSNFSLENHTTCKYDFLEIRNGASETSPLLGKYCGTTIPPNIISHSNSIVLKFVSDRSQSATGFEIFYDTATTGCGGTLYTPTGAIISPNYPLHYGHNAECTWAIHVSKGSAIALFVTDLDIEEHSNCQYDNLQIFDGSSENDRSLAKLCNNQQHPGIIRSSGSSVLVKFTTDMTHNGRGFHLTYNILCNNEVTERRGVIESPNFPNTYPHNHNCTWTIRAPIGSNISLAFSHLTLEHTSTCNADYIQINETSSDQTSPTQLAKFCGTPLPLPPRIITSANIATVSLVTDSSVTAEGFRLEYTVQGCGGDITRYYAYISSPNYPNSYPLRTECIWNVNYPPGYRVQIEIPEIDLEWHASCDFDYIKIYGGEDEAAPMLLNICSRKTTTTKLTSHDNKMRIHFFSDNGIIGKGFRATISTAFGCGGHFTAPESDIITSNYPSPYNVYDACQWLIEVDAMFLVTLEFYDFSLPQSVNCTNGFVAIYDGANSHMPLIAKLCGEKPENPIFNATGNVMLVKFQGDRVNVGKGFRAHYKTGCGRRLIVNSSGEITTPNYPHSPVQGGGCSWIVTASDPGEKVTLIFTTFLATFFCNNANPTFLEVRDGDHADSPLIGTYCGTQAPPEIVSQGNSLYLRTFTFGIFRAVYGITSSYCGGTLSSLSGSFSSPGFPNNYPMGSECIWSIESSLGNRVQLAFRSFNLVSSDFCNADYVEIHENNAGGPLMGRYCSNQLPSNITASHKIWIKFRSEDQSSGPGFQAYYSLAHGNELNGTEGIIESPGYPHGGITHGEVRWLVTVPENRVVSLRFLEIDIHPRRTSCWTAVKMYDGSDTTASELGEFCGYVVPPSVVSYGNQVLIVYESYYHVHSKWRLKWTAVEASTIVIERPSNDSACWYDLHLNSSEPLEFTSPNYPLNYPRNTNCTWMIRSGPHEHIALNFTDIEMDGYLDNCYGDKIEVYTAPEPYTDNWVLNNTLCSRRNITIINPTNVMKVLFFSDFYYNYKGFHAIATPMCGGLFFESSGQLRSSDIVNYISQRQSTMLSFMCEWTIRVRARRTIQITFDNFNLPSDNVCSNMYFMLLNGGSSSSPMLGSGRYCGTSIPSIPETSSNLAFVRLHIKSFSLGSPSFVLRYTEVSVPCGGHLYVNPNAPTATIQSPNFPNPPPHAMECNWIIMSPAGTRLRIDFDSNFHLGHECYWHGANQVEYVELRDGGTESADSLARFCGTMHPQSRLTTGNTLYVSYFANVDHPGGGFKATVQTAVCGGTMTGYSGYIESPNYPQNYSSSQECEWIIKPPNYHELTLTFEKMDTPPSSNCTLTDYVEIRIDDENGPLQGLFCGNSEWQSLDIGSSLAYVKFKSNSAYTASGFRLAYRSKTTYCGDYLQTPTGVITSPNFPQAASINRYCHWTILAPIGRLVTLTFSAFNFPRDPNTNECISYLMVAGSRRQRLKLCGSEIPEPIELSNKYVYITLYTPTLAAGEGFSLEYTTDKENPCGGLLPSPSGTISMLNFTNMNSSGVIHCTWNMDTEVENVTTVLRFSVLDIPGNFSSYCRDSYLTIYGSPYARFGYFCGNMTSFQPIVTSPYRVTMMMLYVYSTQPMTGFYATYNTSACGGVITNSDIEITSPGYPSHYLPNTICHWIVRYPYGERVKVTVLDLQMEDNCNDHISMYDGPSKVNPILISFCGPDIPVPVISSHNVLSIIFQSDGYGSAPGFKLTTADVETGCGGLIQSKNTNISSPNYPSRYDNNVECVWNVEYPIGFRVNATITDRFDIETSGNCDNDYILIEDYDENAWHVVGKKCGHSTPPNVISSSTKMRLTFHTNGNIQGDGFKIMLNAACGGHFTNPSGFIMSPKFPEQYDNDQHCQYIIGHPQHYTNLVFDSQFSIEYESNCSYDSITIYKGNTTSMPLEGRYCGDTVPQPLLVLGQILVDFSSDYIYTASGFRAEYEITECGGVRTDPFGSIHTPKASERYLNNMFCTWVIQGTENFVIALRFISFDVESSYSCYYDYVEVFDGNSTSSNSLLGKLCGNSIPPIVKSSSNVMTVRWHTDSSVTRKGFESYYYFTHKCEEILNNTSGELSSLDANNDGKYEPNLDCIWHIIVDDDQSIQLSFTLFELEPASNGSCQHDFIEVRDGLYSHDPVIGRFCGNSAPSQIKSSSNKMTVIFHSDDVINMAGFQAAYTSIPSVCGHSVIEVTNVSQTLTSLNYPSPFPSHTFCQWKFVNYGYGTIISISFNDLDIPCSEGYIEIHHSNRANGPYRLCGPARINNIEGPNIWMHYFTKTNTAASKGFSLSYKTTGCNVNYTGDFGTIKNMYYPNSYYTEGCNITIIAKPGRTISVYFRQFSLLDSATDDCSEANMTIYDGTQSSDPSLGAFCGSTRPNPVFSTGNSLYLKVASFYRISTYYISYTTSNKGRGCGGFMNDVNGTFTSPFYPHAYNESNECQWLLSVPGYHTMTLTFEFFSLSSVSGCSTNYMEIFEGHSDTMENRVGRFCGNDSPAPYISRESQILVKLVTNITNTAPGFSANFEANTIDLGPPQPFIMSSTRTSEHSQIFNSYNQH